MSAAPAGTSPAQQKNTAASSAPAKDASKPAAALEEDDEFEDFPVEDWPAEEAEPQTDSTHLWEESWDDDDTTDDFSAQLKEELSKVEASKKR